VSLNQELRCSRYAAFLTFFMIPFPVIYLVFSALIFDLDSRGIIALVLSPLFYLSSFFWIITGVGLRRLKKWSWYTFLLAQFFITYLNALNLVHNSNSEYKGWAFAFTLLVQIYVYLAVQRELRVPYLYPRINWWESGIAGMPHLEVDLHYIGVVQGNSKGQILDINGRGCFIKTPIDFSPFQKVTIDMEAFGQKVEIQGYVIWSAKSTVTHPKGVGVRFGELSRQNRRRVRIISQRFIRQRDQKHVQKLPA
jgi:hypothetical protein